MLEAKHLYQTHPRGLATDLRRIEIVTQVKKPCGGCCRTFVGKSLVSGQHPKAWQADLRKIGIVTQVEKSYGECWRTFPTKIDI